MPSVRRRLPGPLASALVLECPGSGTPPVAPPATATAAPSPSIDADTTGGPLTDYADPGSWMLDPGVLDKPVDVFYLYPTAYHKAGPSSSNVADVTDPGMRAGAESAYRRQASAFAEIANIFAPYYRQLDAMWALSLPPDAHNRAIDGAPLEDGTAAFAHYIEHFNKGRPFAIAAHSQGSDVTCHLLAGYLKEHPDVAKRMIVAYVIGYSVTQAYLDANPQLSFASGADDTGVIVSYNTEAPEIASPNPVVLPGAVVINPITWTRSETTAAASESLGAWLPDRTATFHRIPHYADATIDVAKGVLVTSTPDVDIWSPGGAHAFPRGVFHSFDYPFYYFDLQANLATRVAAYQAATGG